LLGGESSVGPRLEDELNPPENPIRYEPTAMLSLPEAVVDSVERGVVWLGRKRGALGSSPLQYRTNASNGTAAAVLFRSSSSQVPPLLCPRSGAVPGGMIPISILFALLLTVTEAPASPPLAVVLVTGAPAETKG